MEIRNRLEDVKVLRTHIGQDLLRFTFPDNWRPLLYDICEKERKGPYKGSYEPIYDKMREFGDKFAVTNLDFTNISVIVEHHKNLVAIKFETLKAFKELHSDRNEYEGHSDTNEEKNELYIKGLLDLCHLRSFVKAVDKFEEGIPNEQRKEYLQHYCSEIKKLMRLIDDERFDLLRAEREMDCDIKDILESRDVFKTFSVFEKKYSDKQDKESDALIDSDNESKWGPWYEFHLRCSDAGIVWTHETAAYSLYTIKHDYYLATQKYIKCVENEDRHFLDQTASEILRMINTYIDEGNTISENMKYLLNLLKDKGIEIEKTESGYSVVSESLS